jgi:hypothetical protein
MRAALFDFISLALVAIVFYVLGHYNVLGPVLQSLIDII